MRGGLEAERRTMDREGAEDTTQAESSHAPVPGILEAQRQGPREPFVIDIMQQIPEMTPALLEEARRTMDREEEEELQPCSRQGREGADMLARIRVCPHRPRKHWLESRCEGAARLAASHLRSRVTLPPELEDVADLQAVLDVAERLPLEVCAFRGCAWTSPADAEDPPGEGLRDHVLEAHSGFISSVACVSDEYLWDTYTQR